MEVFFVGIVIYILYAWDSIKESIKNGEDRNKAIDNKKNYYYNNRGIAIDTTTKEKLIHSTINGDKCLIFKNGKIHTNLSEQLRKEQYKLLH